MTSGLTETSENLQRVRYFLDAQRRHRFNVRLENLFDSDYATGHGRAFPDAGGGAYVTSTLGVPRTLHVSYTLAY